MNADLVFCIAAETVSNR